MATRPRQPMPEDVRAALADAGVQEDYDRRPAYQRNGYLGWIAQAKELATRARRIQQMLEELEQGGVYMNMPHAPSRKRGVDSPADGGSRAADGADPTPEESTP